MRSTKRSRSSHRPTLNVETLEPRQLLATDIVMFNDLVAGDETNVNTTTFAANGVASGSLIDVETGEATPITLTTSENGVTYQNNSAQPSSGTDVFEIFDGFVDFGSAASSSLEISSGDHYTYEFSGLDGGNLYEFVGTAIRGIPIWFNRWTLVTVEGADSVTPAHSTGNGVVTEGLADNQVAIWTGSNNLTNQGFVAQWVDIDPGDDGVFSVVSTQYKGATPGVGTGSASEGPTGYGIAGVRLIEHDNSLRVQSSSPADGELVAVAPDVYETQFNRPIDVSTLDASDLTVNGQAATNVTPLGDAGARWSLPALNSGTQMVEIVAAAIDGVTANDPIGGYLASFTIAAAPQVQNEPASAVLATSATIGATITDSGGFDPALQLYWGTADGGTNANAWQNSVDLGVVELGASTTDLIGLTEDTDYFYRAFASHASGDTWAATTATFTTGSISLPTLITNAATGIGAFSAEISGMITDPGGEAPTVKVYYGLSDGGTNVASWDNLLFVGERVDTFAATIPNLAAETEYFFRATAENSAGATWSPVTLSFTTIDTPRVVINEFMANNLDTLSTRTRTATNISYSGPDQYPDWIELQNLTAQPVDLSGFHLTDNLSDPNRWQFPAGTTIAANGYLVVFASSDDIVNPALDETGRLHTNFSLSSSGENVALTGLDGSVIHSYSDVPRQVQDISYGLIDSEARYLATPTPNAVNSSDIAEFVADTQFSVDRGFYDEPFEVEITTATEGATIRYTLDGTPPSQTRGTVFAGPIAIDGTSTLRAIAYKPGLEPTNVDTQTYIFVDDVIQQTSASTIASGFPTSWGGQSPDYGMDFDVIGPNDDFGGRYADTIRDDLKAIPTLSLVTDIDGIFGSGGIYSNPSNASLEVPTSVEFFTEDGSEEFQINAGVKIQGGAFRSFGLTLKKSLRLKFKTEYGPAKLKYPLFGDDATDEFDTVTLRMEANDGWQWAGANGQPQYARDEFGRRTQLAMGQPASHGRYTHVYINGIYWGMYNMVERPDQSFGESYIGGDKDDWDGINSGNAINADDAARRNRATAAWDTLVSLSRDVSSADNEADRTAAYMRAQGLNPDGSNDPTRGSYVNVENMIDYFLVNWYADNSDWPHKNYYVGRENSPNSEGFHFFMWDAEWSLFLRSNVTGNQINNGAGVAAPIQNFRDSEEFRLLFADHVQQHLVNPGGALYVNPENPNYDPAHPEDNVPAATYAAITEEIFEGLVAESARWGDQHRGTPYTRDNEWDNEYNRLMNNWFPQRTEIFLDHLRTADLYPSVSSPVFRINGTKQHGGQITAGDSLSMSAAASVISTTTPLIEEDSAVTAFVPADGSLETGPGLRWYDPDFDDSGWTSGTNGVGYQNTGSDYEDLINVDVGPVTSSIYTRFEFTLDPGFDASAIEELELKVRYDDGYVAFLNGQQVVSKNAPSPANWDSGATAKRLNILNTLISEANDISSSVDLLQPGKNVLAVHALNHPGDQNDMLIRAELALTDDVEVSSPVIYTLDGSDPRELGGGVVGVTYDGAIPLSATTEVNARAFVNNQWSALNTTTFVINPAEPGDLVISEINFNPADPTAAELAVDGQLDNEDFEFVEVFNRSDDSIELLGLQFNNGVEFEFAAFSMPAGQRAVIVQDTAAFQLRYGNSASILGEFTSGSLSNGGERLTIVDDANTTVFDVAYDDNSLWPQASDGFGASLELIDPAGVSTELASKHYVWRSSSELHGTPGGDGDGSVGIVISEVLAHTDPPLTAADSIELHNPTNQAIDLSGWYLSDSGTNMLKYEIPADTMLGAGEYLVFDESDFNPTPLMPGPSDFALSGANGDDVWLVDPTDSSLRFVDDVHFGATFNGQTLGLTESSNGRLVPLTRNGLGCGNSHALVSDAYIERVNYLPAEPTEAALAMDPTLDSNDLEYLVVSGPVSEGWRIRGGVDIDFPAGFINSPTTWILSFDPDDPANADKLAAFKTHYSIPDNFLHFIGGYSGSLSNSGEQLRLESPDESPVEDPMLTPYVTVDEVIYDDQGDWPSAVPGDPIVRRSSTYFGSDGALWAHTSDGPFFDNVTGDFNGDEQADATDLDLLIDAVNRESQNGAYVLSGTFPVPVQQEVDYYVEEFLGTFYGDTNLNGTVDALDLNEVGIHWQSHVCGGWRNGDFNGDAFVDVADLNALGVNWQRTAVAAARVPRAALSRPVATSIANEHAVATVNSPVRNSYFRQYVSHDETKPTEDGVPPRYRRLGDALSRRGDVSKPSNVVETKATEPIDRVFADLSDLI